MHDKEPALSGLPEYADLDRRLNEERRQLEHARSNYEAILRSRFHALRMMWFSLKLLAGKSSPKDRYAAWSNGLHVHVPPPFRKTSLKRAPLGGGEAELIEAWNARRQKLDPSAAPLTSVIIPVFNHREVTVRCLESIASTWLDGQPVQIIVVDDGSGDDTAAVVTRLEGVDYLRGGTNEGFVHACNRGAALARGKYICFLNNDTVVRDGWLDELIRTVERDETIGIVGSKLVYPDGNLQEAGAIVWRDGSGWNVGRLKDPDDPRYNFVRDVNYVSGAAMLVRADLFKRAGGFSTLFAPAYYEDVDLCFQVQEMGYRVVYQPRSVVIHYESVTSGNDVGGIKRFQEVNRPKFREKWAERLALHPENDRSNVPAATLQNRAAPTILVIDTYVPMYDREAGSQRLFHIVKMLRAGGYNVIFLPDNYAAVQPYTGELQQMGVEVLYHVAGGPSAKESLERVLLVVDIAWISRPELYQKYSPLVRRENAIRIIFDTVDLHYIRKEREAAVLGTDEAEWREWRDIEAAAAATADATVVVTAEEKEALEALGASNIFVVPTIHEPSAMQGRRFENTSGVLFVGNYNHPPNLDAAVWLCNAVMPLVWKRLPNVLVTVAGSNPSNALRELQSQRVKVTGYIPDLLPYFRKNRIFVAPLRFGAGMKGKIGQALEFAQAIVTTPVGAEGFALKHGENAIIVQAEAAEFARAIISIYEDAAQWKRLTDASAGALDSLTPAAVRPQLESVLAARFSVAATP